MGLTAIPYALVLALLMPSASIGAPVLGDGLAILWQPGVLLVLQGLWLLIFFAAGRSKVTGAKVSFHVHWERT
jgi:hypothetical protein